MALTVILPSGVSNTGNFAFGSVSATGNVTANNGMFTTTVNVTSHTGPEVGVIEVVVGRL